MRKAGWKEGAWGRGREGTNGMRGRKEDAVPWPHLGSLGGGGRISRRRLLCRLLLLLPGSTGNWRCGAVQLRSWPPPTPLPARPASARLYGRPGAAAAGLPAAATRGGGSAPAPLRAAGAPCWGGRAARPGAAVPGRGGAAAARSGCECGNGVTRRPGEGCTEGAVRGSRGAGEGRRERPGGCRMGRESPGHGGRWRAEVRAPASTGSAAGLGGRCVRVGARGGCGKAASGGWQAQSGRTRTGLPVGETSAASGTGEVIVK